MTMSQGCIMTSVSAQGQCDKGLASVYHEEIISVGGEQRRLVVTNGIPSHTYHDYTGTNR